MTGASRGCRSVMAAALVTACAVVMVAAPGNAQPQPPPPPASEGRWMVGASAGFWDRVTRNNADGRNWSTAFDVTVQRELDWLNRIHPPAIRVQVGRGNGDSFDGPGFDYTRVMVGYVKEITDASKPPFHVYYALGGGAYRVKFPFVPERHTRPSLFGALGLDVTLGSSPLSIGAEYQLHSISNRIYATATLGLRLYFP